jgi:GT2 family glycosyltransferase
LSELAKVAVIIPTRGMKQMVEECVTALVENTDKWRDRLDIWIVEQGGTEVRDHMTANVPIGVDWTASEEGWSYSEINNHGVAQTDAPFILLLNNDCNLTKDCLEFMLKEMADQKVGIVGAKLLYPNNEIQHVGVVFRKTGQPYHLAYRRLNDEESAPAAFRTEDFDAVTFACVLIRRQVWDELEGLDPEFFFNYEDVDFCLRAREKGWRIRMPHEAVAYHLEGASRDHRKSEKHSVERNLKIFQDRWVESGRLREISYQEFTTAKGPEMRENVNVAVFGMGEHGASWWRVLSPAKMLAKKKLCNIRIFGAHDSTDTLQKEMEKAHLAWFHGWHSPWLKQLAQYRYWREWGLCYDYDDNIVSISPFSQAYKNFGTEEFKLQDHDGRPVWLWRHGSDDFDIHRNVENKTRQMEILHLADQITTSVEPLVELFGTLNNNVAHLPNCIDFNVFQHMYSKWQRAPGPVRIGWHGGDNHYHDICHIAKPLVDFVNRHDVRLVLFGAFYKGALKGIDESKVEEHEWSHIEAFPLKLAQLAVDVAVIPLMDPEDVMAGSDKPLFKFNKYKSDIKFLEYGALRVPSLVAGRRDAYKFCEDGVNSLTYTDGMEFYHKLEELCSDPDLRRRIGTAALDWIREHRSLETRIDEWADVLTKASTRFKYDSDSFILDLIHSQAKMVHYLRDEGRPEPGTLMADEMQAAMATEGAGP